MPRQLTRLPVFAFSTDKTDKSSEVRVFAPKEGELTIGDGKEELTYSQEYYILNR